MGIHIIKMPDIGEGIAEVELVGWHVKVGDTVAEDQPLADVMTDKATVEIPSPVVGKVISLGGDVGQVMAVGGELIRLEVEGEGNVKAGAAAAAAPAAKAAVPAAGGIAADGAQRAGGPSLVESGVAASTPATSPPARSSSSASTSASASGPASAPAKSPATR
uniref:biotin/lipoyl-containing protein n=2 Tax=Alcaligenaceae TaxID=506 RepID=UPI0028A1F9A6